MRGEDVLTSASGVAPSRQEPVAVLPRTGPTSEVRDRQHAGLGGWLPSLAPYVPPRSAVVCLPLTRPFGNVSHLQWCGCASCIVRTVQHRYG